MCRLLVICICMGLAVAGCAQDDSATTADDPEVTATAVDTTALADEATTSEPATTVADTPTSEPATTTTATTIEPEGGPVAPDGAQIEITYTDDGASYFGERVIVEGTVTITLTNETDAPATWSVWGYPTESEALAEELAFLAEGNNAVPINPLPVPGYYEIDYEWPDDVGEPGSQIWKVHLAPGTWIFDVGPESFRSTGLWRAAVIEVVAE